jgi:hypothetical protein
VRKLLHSIAHEDDHLHLLQSCCLDIEIAVRAIIS